MAIEPVVWSKTRELRVKPFLESRRVFRQASFDSHYVKFQHHYIFPWINQPRRNLDYGGDRPWEEAVKIIRWLEGQGKDVSWKYKMEGRYEKLAKASVNYDAQYRHVVFYNDPSLIMLLRLSI